MDGGSRSQTRLKKSALTNKSTTHNTHSTTNLDGLRSKTALNSSQMLSMGSRQSIRNSHVGLDRKTAAIREGNIVIRDDEGNDVTPQSLFSRPQQGKGVHHVKDGTSSATDMSMTSMVKETVSDVLNHLEQMTTASWSSSVMGKSGASFATSSRAASGSESTTQNDDDESSSVASGESVDDVRAHTPGSTQGAKQSSGALPGLSTQPKPAAEIDPNKNVHITLTETNTMVLLDVPSICVSSESIDEAAAVKTANAKYKELKSIIPNNDNYVSRGMQTFNNALKSKDVQATSQKQANAEIMVNQWAIYDAYNEGTSRVQTADGDQLPKDVELDSIGIEFSAAPGSLTGQAALIEASGSDVGSRSMMRSNSVFVASTDDAGSDINTSMSNSRTHIEGGPSMTTQARPETEKEPVIHVNSDRLLQSLQLMERIVVGNNYEKRLISYRNAPDAEKLEHHRIQSILRALERQNEENNLDAYDQDQGKQGQALTDMDTLNSNLPTLQLLWSYRCELTRGRSVLYMAYNKQNEDILAVAYGHVKGVVGSNVSNTTSVAALGTNNGGVGGPGVTLLNGTALTAQEVSMAQGLILCWSVKNPEWPERIYTTKSSVTSIDFSRMNPNLLAAGLMDGRVVIYDIRRKDGKPVLDDSDANGKHHDPVWELKWIERERVMGDEHSRGESLVSVSTDGRVTQWTVRKGLEYTDLMTLKRLTKQKSGPSAAGAGSGTNGNAGKTTSFIARQTGGLCFDFNPKDSNIYMVGTEDGQIHKCSCSYNEQYLSTYYAHTGPVNKVKWSPFLPNVFLSCSADWTVRLWNQDSEKEEIFKFQSGRDSVSDIAWSPHLSTCFGSVSSDGRLEIWDLQFSVLDPVINHNVLDRQLTSIIFSSQSPTILTGDDNGVVTVYKMCRNSGHLGSGSGNAAVGGSGSGGSGSGGDGSSDGLASTTGVMDQRAGLDPRDHADAAAWRADQAHALLAVISDKNKAASVSTANATNSGRS